MLFVLSQYAAIGARWINFAGTFMLHVLSRKPLSVWLLITSLYTTQVLGLSFFSVALVSILRGQGRRLSSSSPVYIVEWLAFPIALPSVWTGSSSRQGKS